MELERKRHFARVSSPSLHLSHVQGRGGALTGEKGGGVKLILLPPPGTYGKRQEHNTCLKERSSLVIGGWGEKVDCRYKRLR